MVVPDTTRAAAEELLLQLVPDGACARMLTEGENPHAKCQLREGRDGGAAGAAFPDAFMLSTPQPCLFLTAELQDS